MVRKFAGIEIIGCRIHVQGQHKKEHTSLPRITPYVKMSAMSLHNFPCDKEPQPHPVLYVNAWNAVVLLENTGEHLGWNPSSPITYRERGFIAYLLQRHDDGSTLW